MIQRRTYLDYNASAPLRSEARDAMLAALALDGNASSVHGEGRRARAVIETARLEVAALVNARAADVVFTSGASEANATVLAGGWDMVLLSALEHDSVRMAAKRSGARVVEMPVTPLGVIDEAAFATVLAQLDREIAERCLVCVQLANNETGVVQPVAAMARLAHAAGVRVHSDAVQVPGRMRVDCCDLGVDYLTISAHKLGGPKGAGALVVVDGAPLRALIAGGGQERGRRAGTENVAAIAGFGAAARSALREQADVSAVRGLRDALERSIAAVTPGAVVIGQEAMRLANTCCVALPGLAAETAVIRMDLAGIAISSGAACSSGKVGQSVALMGMGLSQDVTGAAIRITLGTGSTSEDVDAFVKVWTKLAAAHQRAA